MEKQKETHLMKAIALAVAIIILSVIAALVVGSILDSSVFSEGDITGTNTNESLGVVDNETNVTFAIIATQPTATCNLDVVNNATGGEVITGAGNFTYYSDACNIIMQDDSPYNNESINVTYDYTYVGEGSTIIDVSEVESLFGEFIDGLLGFLGIIGIVLGVIWLIMYVAKLFSRGGLDGLGATA